MGVGSERDPEYELWPEADRRRRPRPSVARQEIAPAPLAPERSPQGVFAGTRRSEPAGGVELLTPASGPGATAGASPEPHTAGQSAEVLRFEPLHFEIFDQFGIGHPESTTLAHGERVGLDLRGRIDVVKLRIEQRLAPAELPDVAELMDDIEVDGPEIAVLQMMRAHQEMAVDVARAHVAESGGKELDFEPPEDLRGLSAEEFADGVNSVEPSEEPGEREQPNRRLPFDRHPELRLQQCAFPVMLAGGSNS
jgi:hypothetical protein